MQTVALIIPVSQDQADAIEDHLLLGAELGMVPDERAWMIAQAQKKHWGCRIVAADLDVSEAEWTLTLEIP